MIRAALMEGWMVEAITLDKWLGVVRTGVFLRRCEHGESLVEPGMEMVMSS